MEALCLPRAASPLPSSKELGGGQLGAVSPQDPEGARPWGTGVPGRWADLGLETAMRDHRGSRGHREEPGLPVPGSLRPGTVSGHPSPHPATGRGRWCEGGSPPT